MLTHPARRYMIYCIFIVAILSIRSFGNWTCCRPFDVGDPFRMTSDFEVVDVESTPDPEYPFQDARSEHFGASKFYEAYPFCWDEATSTPKFTQKDCTEVGEVGGSGRKNLMLQEYNYTKTWHQNFVVVLLATVAVLNGLLAVIHAMTKYSVTLDALHRGTFVQTKIDDWARK
jgi:hypothetical protein